MHRLLAFSLGLFLILIPFTSTAHAEEISIEDLLIPEVPSLNDNTEDNQQLALKPTQEIPTWDDLLGPEQIFPFLPDNHRDSGTGKFNSY